MKNLGISSSNNGDVAVNNGDEASWDPWNAAK